MPAERQLEELIETIEGVVGCRVLWDREGRPSEIHVVVTGERPPKLVVRDIQTLLLVHFNVSIPHQKVSVVVTRSRGASEGGPRSRMAARPGPPPGPAPVVEGRAGPVREPLEEAEGPLEPRPEPSEPVGQALPGPPPLPPAAQRPMVSPPLPAAVAVRPEFPWRLESVTMRMAPGETEVSVALSDGESRQATGSARGPQGESLASLLGARAVVDALGGRLPGGGPAVLHWVDVAGPSSAPAVVVMVLQAPAGAPSRPRWASGSSPLSDNAALAGALAALEALAKLSPPEGAGL
ncbi:MAG: hypothetical protein IMX02_08065 [Limnochordaceae bacterium]|nr:hypothetical protein [Limnochordaceae bacterium]